MAYPTGQVAFATGSGREPTRQGNSLSLVMPPDGGMRTCVADATGSLRVDKKQTPRKWGVCFWPTRQDSNLRPSESESDALSSCATGRYALYCSTVFCKSKPLNAFFSFFAQRLSLTRFCPGKVFSAFRNKSLDEMPAGRYNTTVKSEEGGNLEQMDADSCQCHIRRNCIQIATGFCLC